MDLLLQQVLSGLANGGIYACVALAVVVIYRSPIGITAGRALLTGR